MDPAPKDPVLRLSVGARVSSGGASLDIPVSSAVFRLAAGTVPSVTLTVDMGEARTSAFQDITVTQAVRVTPDKLLRMHAKACEFADDPDNAVDVDISVTDVNDEKAGQDVNLKGWLLVGAGLIGGSAGGGPVGVRLRIAHPCARLDRAPGFLGMRTGMDDTDDMVAAIMGDGAGESGGSDIVSYFAAAAAYDAGERDREASSVTAAEGGMDPDAALEAAEAAMAAAAAGLPTYFQSLSLLPLVDDAFAESGDVSGAIAYAVSQYFEGSDRPGLLELFLNDLLPSLQLTFRTSADDPVFYVVPRAPWDEAAESISIKDVTSMTLPPWSDPPVGGVTAGAAEGAAYGGGSFISYGKTKEEGDTRTDAVLYIPDGPRVAGRIITVGIPEWLKHAAAYVYAERSPSSAATGSMIDGTAAQSAGKLSAPVGVLAAESFVKSVYLLKRGERDEVLLVTPLQLKQFGKAWNLATGAVYGVRGEDGSDMFFFYATDVTHTLDIGAGTAETVIRGAHFRTAGHPLHGTPNPLYGGSGKEKAEG